MGLFDINDKEAKTVVVIIGNTTERHWLICGNTTGARKSWKEKRPERSNTRGSADAFHK